MCEVLFPLEPRTLPKTLDNGLLFLENITVCFLVVLWDYVFLCPSGSLNTLLIGACTHAFAHTLALHSF